MLAKPEYFSPPDEVCCWQGRRGGAPSGRCCWPGRRDRVVAGRGAVAERHREAVAGVGAVTELLLAGALRRRAIGKMLMAGALQRSAIGKLLLVGAPWWSAIGKMLLAGVPCGKTMRQHREAAAEGYHLRSLLWYSAHSLGRKRHREMSCGINGCCARCLANIVRISSRVVEIILLGSSR